MNTQPCDAIAVAVNTELERIGEHHSCIFAAAVLTEVLHRMGYPAAYPLTVGAHILNPAYVAWTVKYGCPSDPDSESKCQAEGGEHIGLGTASTEAMPPGVWAGHLVVVIPNLFGDCHAVCDLTITQVNKHGSGINLMPRYFAAPDTFVTGQTEFHKEVNGSLILYMAFPQNHSYIGTPNWMNRLRWIFVADHVIKYLA
jgi:hypothetical protein